MGAPEAAPVIQLMALTLPLAGLTVVPYAHLQREFMQSRLFAIDAVNFTLGTTVTLVLALDGHGPLSLAIGRVVGQVASTLLQFGVTRQPLSVGWRSDVAVSGIRFGLPLAFAGLLSWTLLNIDTMVVGSVAGATALGFYVLAFNVSSWPSSVVGTAVKAVAFPAFAQRGRRPAGAMPRGWCPRPHWSGPVRCRSPWRSRCWPIRWCACSTAVAGHPRPRPSWGWPSSAHYGWSSTSGWPT